MEHRYDMVIVGGGFAGVKTAQDAVRLGLSVCLISDKTYFEYYPAMYRIVAGAAVETVALPIADVRDSNKITIIHDVVNSIDLTNKKALCVSGDIYQGRFLVIALGVSNSYFGIPGMEEHSFGFKSIGKAMHLHERIEDLFRRHCTSEIDEQLTAFHFLIAGGGVSGVELAGELAHHTKTFAKKYKVPFSRVSITIVESNASLVKMFPEKAQKLITNRLKKLKVRILCNQKVTYSKSWTVQLSDMTVSAKTVIWAAGVAPHPLCVATKEMPITEKKRILVNQSSLEVVGYLGVYAIGDCADTAYSGLAQTALLHGSYVARHTFAQAKGIPVAPYNEKQIVYDVPVGKYWGVFIYSTIVISGFFPWALRFFIDARFYFLFLPFGRAIKIIFAMLRQ